MEVKLKNKIKLGGQNKRIYIWGKILGLGARAPVAPM